MSTQTYNMNITQIVSALIETDVLNTVHI